MLTLQKETTSALLGRKNYVFSHIHTKSSTPSRLHLRKEIAKSLQVSEDHVAVTKVRTRFGSHESVIHAQVYDHLDQLQQFHPLKAKDAKKLSEKKEGTQ